MADGDADYSPKLAENLLEIFQSDRFVTECFKERNLKISQALCLLWHEQSTGDVPGRKASAPHFGNISAAVIIDLYVLGKVSFEDAQASCLGVKYKEMVLQVKDFTPTNSYLDNCMFNQMLERTRKHPDKPRSVSKWILKGSNYHKPSCVSATFDSLVDLGLMKKEPRLLGTSVRYPVINAVPQNELVKEIQMIALAGHAVDGFTWTLLKLARFSDSLYLGGALMLKHLFHKKEYEQAKKNIEKLVETKKENAKKRGWKKDKDLEFYNLCEIEQ